MTETIRDIVTFALRGTGVTGLGQDPLPQDINAGYTLLSRMLAQWQVKRWLVPGLTDISAISDGAISNRIGPGQRFNSIRPDKINAAYFKIVGASDPSVSYPLVPIFSYEDYARLSLKNLNTFPGFIFYDGAYPSGNVFVWPKPSAAQYEIHLIVKMPIQQKTSIETGSILTAGAAYTDGAYVGVALTGGSGTGATADITVTAGAVAIVTLANPGQGYAINDTLSVAAANVGGTGAGFTYTVNTTVSNLDTIITLPEEYLEPIHNNLVVRMTAHYQYDPNPVVGALAKTGLNVLKNANAQVPKLVIPWANRSGFNIYAPDVYQ